MDAKKQLRRPENWQDFERLCKKLWGEVWKCPEIKRHGRSGQPQSGVDVYGIPRGESQYYGIQCKGKDEYTRAQLTTQEIDTEISKADSFNPPLAKLYFATTAVKDTKIEEHIRIRNIENRGAGKFEVHLFSWEEIVDLLDENRSVLSWYLGLMDYSQSADLEVLFDNGTIESSGSVRFIKEKIIHKYNSNIPSYAINSKAVNDKMWRRNRSYFGFGLIIRNTGNVPIDNIKISLQVNGSFHSLSNSDSMTLSKTEVEVPQKSVVTIRPDTTLALEEEYITDPIFLKPEFRTSDFEIAWKMVSNQTTKSGVLKLHIDVTEEERTSTNYVAGPSLECIEVIPGLQDDYQ